MSDMALNNIKYPKFLSFSDWVKYVFDTEEEKQDEWPVWDEGAHDTIAYLTKLFQNADEMLSQYSDENISRGLNFLASNNFSNTMFALLDESVPWHSRQNCIQANYFLVKNFFPKRCSPKLYSLNMQSTNMDFLCCYWFDLMPIHGRLAVPANVNMEFLDVFRKILTIDLDICRESALSGLGSWCLYHPVEVNKILDEFVSNNPELSVEVREIVEQTRRSENIL